MPFFTLGMVMKRAMIFLALSLLVGCNSHENEPIPQGNMPMTEQEYREYQLHLRECQRAPKGDSCQ